MNTAFHDFLCSFRNYLQYVRPLKYPNAIEYHDKAG